MPGIDLLISRYLSDEIKKSLDQNILKKLEKELFFEHGMSIKLSIEHFSNFHNVLKNISGDNLNEFEKNCVEKIIQVKKINNYYQIKIINPELSEKIFDFFGDPESRKILVCLMEKKLTISQLLKKSRVLKSSLYRKIETLLLNGMILETGKILTNQKRVSQYECLFDEIRMVLGNDLVVEVDMSAKKFNESSITGLWDFNI